MSERRLTPREREVLLKLADAGEAGTVLNRNDARVADAMRIHAIWEGWPPLVTWQFVWALTPAGWAEVEKARTS